MSLSSGIDQNNPDPDYRGKFYPDLIPFNHPLAQQGLGSVLQVNNSAFIPNTTTKQDATDFDLLGCVKIETGTVGMGNQPALVIGEPGDILQIKGATLLGSLLVGNGLNTEGLPVGANGLVLKANSNALNGLGVEWAVDGTSGITGVSAGPNITIDSITNPLIPAISLANPFNAGADIGSQQVQGAVGDITMDLMGDHLNYQNTTTGDNSSYIPTQISFSDQTGDVSSLLSNFQLGFIDNGNSAVAQLGADAGLVIKPQPLGASGTELTFTKLEIIKEDPVALTIETTTANKDGFFTITEQTPAGSGEKGASSIASNTTQGEVSVLYQNQTGGGAGTYQGVGNIITNSTATTLTLQSNNITPVVSNQQIVIETPAVGDAIIAHTYGGGTARNLDITTQGNLSVVASNGGITLNAGALGIGSVAPTTITNSNTGGQTNPTLTLTNTNATGSVALEVYKNKPTAGLGGDVLFNQSVYGKDGANNKQEYTRISHTIRDNTSGNEDGSIEMSCFVNGSVNTFLQLNGIENEVNCLKNLDMTGKNIVANTGDMVITTGSSSGTGNLSVQAKGFSQFGGEIGFTNLYNTNGNITINAGGVVSDLEFNCLNWISATSSGNSGQHLRIKLNGVYYKIQLLND